MTREALHELIERIFRKTRSPRLNASWNTSAGSAAFRATLSAPPDDEPVTDGDAESIARAHRDIGVGKAVSHEGVLRENSELDEVQVA